ncbi:hypothetical protein HCA69_16000 [Listeria grandensis]|uniref:Uncharacterized protein n=1 Tax=Listeria grandensis TaxID=1494963 RepID=A0A7X0Y6E3_9LIST|nr:hypothetical protein [Listeria grandensis]MBC1937866.1 hypothetical protein [Listeria grandensis]
MLMMEEKVALVFAAVAAEYPEALESKKEFSKGIERGLAKYGIDDTAKLIEKKRSLQEQIKKRNSENDFYNKLAVEKIMRDFET